MQCYYFEISIQFQVNLSEMNCSKSIPMVNLFENKVFHVNWFIFLGSKNVVYAKLFFFSMFSCFNSVIRFHLYFIPIKSRCVAVFLFLIWSFVILNFYMAIGFISKSKMKNKIVGIHVEFDLKLFFMGIYIEWNQSRRQYITSDIKIAYI